MDDEKSPYLGMKIDQVQQSLNQRGFQVAFFGPGERIDFSEMDRSYEWLAFEYDKDKRVVRQLYIPEG